MGIIFCCSNEYSQKTKLEKDYFKLINSCLTDAYNENRNSKLNQTISLQKKEFGGNVINKTYDRYIDWLDYLCIFLRDQIAEGKEWARELFDKINLESYANQIQFQNEFFVYEYKILTCPRITKKIIKKNDEENIYDDSKNFGFDFKNNFFASFSSFISEADNPSTSKSNIKETINDYIQMFNKHISNTDHPINVIISHFVNAFCKYVNKRLEVLKSEEFDNDKVEIQCNIVIRQLQNFIEETEVITKLFYSKSISFNFFQNEKDEFKNLITSTCFKTGKLHETIFEFLTYCYSPKIENLRQKVSNYQNVTPQDVNVKSKFCLNERTDILKTELDKKYDPNDENANILIEKSVHSKSEENFSENSSDSEEKKEEMKITSESAKLFLFTDQIIGANQNKNNLINNNEPYTSAVEVLKKLDSHNAPFEKLFIISSVSGQITKCINDYWKDIKDRSDTAMFNITADELMPIYIYIIIKANMPGLLVHSAMVRLFTNNNTKTSAMGYYLTTMEGSIDFICETKDVSDFNTGRVSMMEI